MNFEFICIAKKNWKFERVALTKLHVLLIDHLNNFTLTDSLKVFSDSSDKFGSKEYRENNQKKLHKQNFLGLLSTNTFQNLLCIVQKLTSMYLHDSIVT